MSRSKIITAGMVLAIGTIFTFVSVYIKSPVQTYDNGVAYPGKMGSSECSTNNSPLIPDNGCATVHSVDYGFPLHAMRANDGIYYPDIQEGNYINIVGIVGNFIFYLGVTFLVYGGWRFAKRRIMHL